jgi:hypothetical protein
MMIDCRWWLSMLSNSRDMNCQGWDDWQWAGAAAAGGAIWQPFSGFADVSRSSDHEMHEKCVKLSTDFEVSIVQKDHEWLQSKWVIKNHEERKQISSDQWDLNFNEFFQKQTSISRQMNLQNQKKRTRRDSALQSALNDSRIRTNRKIKLHENIRFDD